MKVGFLINFKAGHFIRIIQSTFLSMSFLFIGLFSGHAIAYCYDDCVYQEKLYSGVFPPAKIYYVGLGYTESWVPVRPDWNKFFDKPHAGAGFYFGRRFCNRIGLEVGYEWNINKPKNYEVLNGNSLLTVQNLSGGTVVVIGKARFKTGYVDLHTFVPLFPGPYFECFRKTYRPELILLLGVANTKPKFNIKAFPRSSYLSRQLVPISGRTKAVFRFGLGFQAFIWEDFGFRAIYRYHTTSALRARNGIPVIPANQKIFRDSQSISLSLFMVFRPF